MVHPTCLATYYIFYCQGVPLACQLLDKNPLKDIFKGSDSVGNATFDNDDDDDDDDDDDGDDDVLVVFLFLYYCHIIKSSAWSLRIGWIQWNLKFEWLPWF